MKRYDENMVGPQTRKQKKNHKFSILYLLSLLAGLQAATQSFANMFDYHEALGQHLMHIYAPWSIIIWYQYWKNTYSHELFQALSIGLAATSLGFIIIFISQVLFKNSAKAHHHLHGSARWAKRQDLYNSGLLRKPQTLVAKLLNKPHARSEGVYVGGWQDSKGRLHYLRHSGPEHILTYAPTRSGKGVGLVIPTLLSWPHSTVITDLKGELWALTAGWRKQYAKNKVLRFEPAASHVSARWNPLDEIRIGTAHEVRDVQNLANLIVNPDGKGLNTHWQKTSFALLVGVILHVLYKARHEGTTASLPQVDAILSDPERNIDDLWAEMIEYPHVNGKNHPVIGSAARDMLDRPKEEEGSVLSTAKSYLTLYRDPVVADNISHSDFCIKDIMNHADPVSLYIITQPNDKARLRPLVRILITMIINLLADSMEFENGRSKAHYKHRLLVMLDEFPSLGKLEILQESLAFVAGYGIKCYLICQDINQLKSEDVGYGKDESITSNCHIQNAYPPNRIETAEHLSRLTGQTTVVKQQITTSGRRTAALLSQVSRTVQEIQRPLLTPDECLRMPGPRKNSSGEIEEAGDMVVYIAGYPAIYGKQILYFQDPFFQQRASVPAPQKSDKIKIISYEEENIKL